jgi:endonuclease/exonuclease/phosphatase (EEP) superfamily protein YafD
MKNLASLKNALVERLRQTFKWTSFRQDSAFTRYAFIALCGSCCAIAAPLYPYSTSLVRLVIDLAGHFVWAYLLLAMLTLAIAKSALARWFAAGALAVSVIALGQAEATRLTALPAGTGATIRVLSANAFVNNQSTEKFTALLDKSKPDVVFVQEVTPAWATVLETLKDYPYRKIIPRNDSFGIALLSRHPLKKIVVLDEDEFDIPALGATMNWQGQDVELIAIHPLPPISPKAYADRNERLSRHARSLTKSGRPAIMAGDFNATPWSAGLAVVQEAGMVRATPLTPTWPAHLGPIPAVIPIDHIVVSNHWSIVNSERGPQIGSDHFPIEATMQLKPRQPTPGATR